MNLLGLKKTAEDSTLTLDKINARLKMAAENTNIKLSIIQSHSESKVVSFLHKKRNKYDHIILSPGVWNINGYIIRETLYILKFSLSIVLTNEYKTSIFDTIVDKSNMIIDDDYIDGYLKLLKSL